jgi:hypothetical protein
VDRLRETREAADFSARSHEGIAALLRPQNQKPSASADENNSLEGGLTVNFNEFIAQNPGAESDVIAYAKTKLGPGADEARKAESDRQAGILALAGVQLSDEIKAALAGGVTPEAFAVATLTKQRDIEARAMQAGQSMPQSPGKVAQLPAEQSGIKPKEDGDVATEAGIREFVRTLKGGM